MYKSQIRQQRADAESKYWDRLRLKLLAIESLHEAWAFTSHSPPANAVGYRFFSNLGDFLSDFSPPLYASQEELKVYYRLLKKFVAEGSVKAEVSERLLEDLKKAILHAP